MLNRQAHTGLAVGFPQSAAAMPFFPGLFPFAMYDLMHPLV
jgi:hypothetical protein